MDNNYLNKEDLSVYEYMKVQDKRLKKIECLLSLSKTVLNIDEVCLLTGLSKSTVYKFTHKGKIPYYRQAKHLYFDRIEIENWLKQNRQKTVDEYNAEASTFLSINNKAMQ